MTLPYHIRKWWDVANDRRQRLIVQKHKAGKGLSLLQENEYILLQAVAEKIIEWDSSAVMAQRLSQGPRQKDKA